MALRQLLLFIFLITSPLYAIAHSTTSAFIYSVDTQEDLDRLKQKALEDDKFLILMFLGSTWCPWSQKMEEEVLSSGFFLQELNDVSLIAKVEISCCQSQDIQLHDLMKNLRISESPTVLLFSSSGQLIKKEGFLSQDAKEWVSYWKEGLISFKDIMTSLDICKDFKQERLLEDLYQKACYHGFEELKNKICEIGIKIAKRPFFFLEKYEILSKTKKFKHPDMISLRKKISQLDPKNKELSHLKLAIIDFTSIQNRKKNKNPFEVVSPLVQYIKDFGMGDHENLWKIELMVSQYFLSRGNYSMANEFATKSKLHAPDCLKEDLLSTIKYIDSVIK
jgi:protein disulfide-isomerase